MNKKINYIMAALFSLFFFIGWEIGITPIQQPIENMKNSTQNFYHKLAMGPTFSLPAGYITENQMKMDVLHYDLDIDLFPDQKLLKGKGIITFIVYSDIPSIDLNFYDNMKIHSLNVNGFPSEYSRGKTSLNIPVKTEIGDTVTVEIFYEGSPKREGLSSFVFGEINGESLVYSLNEPTYASTWFPCSDRPDDKALLDIRITNTENRISVSNGVLIDSSTSDGRKTFHWRTHYPISTYLIALYSSAYTHFTDHYISSISGDTLDLQYYVLPKQLNEAKADFEEHPQMLKFLSFTFGEYPFMKEKYGVAAFLWQMGAMEHQTITGIGSNFITGKKYFTDIYLHELAHHWWGNAVGPKTWNDIWLNEGFATYSEALYSEWKDGPLALQTEMKRKKNENFSGILSNPGKNLFSNTVYDKGAWVLHMLRKEIGEKRFFSLLRNYFEKYKYQNASTEDFKSLAEQISGKNLDLFFNQWVHSDINLHLRYHWNISKRKDSYLLTIEVEQIQDDYSTFVFPLDIEIVLNTGEQLKQTFNINSRQKSFEFGVQNRPVNLIFDPDNWLLAKLVKKKSE
jgi:aminopeptidase N